MQAINEFSKLVELFKAGGGEFHFFNLRTQRFLNIRFTRSDSKANRNTSYVDICFSKDTEVKNYLDFGKINFYNYLFQIRSQLPISEKNKQAFIKSLDYVFNHIFNGNEFGSHIIIYYADKCCRCSKPLYNQSSKSQGFGHECAEFFSTEAAQTRKQNAMYYGLKV